MHWGQGDTQEVWVYNKTIKHSTMILIIYIALLHLAPLTARLIPPDVGGVRPAAGG